MHVNCGEFDEYNRGYKDKCSYCLCCDWVWEGRVLDINSDNYEMLANEYCTSECIGIVRDKSNK
jgi:hypothetical protein